MDTSDFEVESLLIDCVRQRPLFFNKKLKEFKDAVRKENAWLSITEIIGIPAEECKLRWTRLREYFGRQVRAKSSTPSGSAASETPREWAHFRSMQWLQDFMVTRKGGYSSYRALRPAATSMCFSGESSNVEGILTEEESNGSLVQAAWHSKTVQEELPRDEFELEVAGPSSAAQDISPGMKLNNKRVNPSPDSFCKKKQRKESQFEEEVLKELIQFRGLFEECRPKPEDETKNDMGITAFLESCKSYMLQIPNHKQLESRLEIIKVIQSYLDEN